MPAVMAETVGVMGVPLKRKSAAVTCALRVKVTRAEEAPWEVAVRR